VIIDTSHPAGEALLAFLHGQFIPALRVRRTPRLESPDAPPPVADDVLFGALEVGYRTDVILWHTLEDLQARLAERIEIITREPEWIGSAEEAAEYFSSAAKRKEKVFLSYAQEDADRGAEFSVELSRHFQDVFDYRRRGAIPTGAPWLDQIYEELSAAAVGVLLISAEYQESRYCMDEARQLFDAHQNDRLVIVPVKLDQAAPPLFLKDLQYERIWQRTPREIISDLIGQLPSETGS
jgi:TIR domain